MKMTIAKSLLSPNKLNDKNQSIRARWESNKDTFEFIIFLRYFLSFQFFFLNRIFNVVLCAKRKKFTKINSLCMMIRCGIFDLLYIFIYIRSPYLWTRHRISYDSYLLLSFCRLRACVYNFRSFCFVQFRVGFLWVNIE